MSKIKEITLNGLQYRVTRDGRIFGKRKELKQRLNEDGYCQVTIGVENKRNSKLVHQLVALAFIPKPNDIEVFEVNHIDYNRTNNNVDNLEWLTHKENVRHSAKIGRHVSLKGKLNPNYGNDTLKKRLEENPEFKDLWYARKGKQNGRCTPVKMTDLVNHNEFSFDYIRECSKFLIDKYEFKTKLDCISYSIVKSIKRNQPYKKRFRFEYI